MCCSCCPWARSDAIFLIQVCQEQRDHSGMVCWALPGWLTAVSWTCSPELVVHNKNQNQALSGMIFFVSHNQHSGCHSPAHNTTEQIVGCAAAIPLTVCQGYPCPLPPAASAGAWLSWLPLTCQTAWYIWTGIPKCCKLGCSKIFLMNR